MKSFLKRAWPLFLLLALGAAAWFGGLADLISLRTLQENRERLAAFVSENFALSVAIYAVNADTAKIEALQSIANAAQAVRDAQYRLDNYIMPAELQGFSTMEALDLMQKKLDEARLAFEPVKFLSSSDPKREELKEALDQAQADYNAAVRRLDYEYALQVAQSNLEKARQDFEKWNDGPNADDVAAAQARIAAAQATLNQAWIEAPFDGEVTRVDSQPGDQVSINTPAFRLDDT